MERSHAIANYNVDHYPLAQSINISTSPITIPEFPILAIPLLLLVLLLTGIAFKHRIYEKNKSKKHRENFDAF